jgi:predicted aldo/keto reductase-like oxidoreductase
MPEVSVVLSGMGTMQMLEENCDSADRSGVGRLTATELEMLDSVAGIVRRSEAIPCTSCHYCMPCPAGVNIPENLTILNNMGAENRFPYKWFARRSYRQLASTAEHLNPDKTNGRATLCTQCGVCLSKCPQSIDIPVELQRVDGTVLRPIRSALEPVRH